MKQSNFEFQGDKYENQMVFQIWYPKDDIRNPDVDKKVKSEPFIGTNLPVYHIAYMAYLNCNLHRNTMT